MDKTQHEGIRHEVKARYLEEGLEAFEDFQALELLLFYCVPAKDTNELAKAMLKEFGTLSALFLAEPKDIMEKCDVTEHVAVLISLIPSMIKRSLQSKMGNTPILSCSTMAGEYAVSLFKDIPTEAIFGVYLNAQNKVNYAAMAFEGEVSEEKVNPKVITDKAVRYRSSSVMLVQKHIDGNLEPSRTDIEVAKNIFLSLESLEIKVFDYIIISGDKYWSLKEQTQT